MSCALCLLPILLSCLSRDISLFLFPSGGELLVTGLFAQPLPVLPHIPGVEWSELASCCYWPGSPWGGVPVEVWSFRGPGSEDKNPQDGELVLVVSSRK